MKLSLGGSYPTSWMVVEFESDLIRAHKRKHERREGQRTPARQAAEAPPAPGSPLVALHRAGNHSTAKLGDLFGVARTTWASAKGSADECCARNGQYRREPWTLSGEHERATYRFSKDGSTQEISWEWKPAEEWLPLCDRTAHRIG